MSECAGKGKQACTVPTVAVKQPVFSFPSLSMADSRAVQDYTGMRDMVPCAANLFLWVRLDGKCRQMPKEDPSKPRSFQSFL